MIAELPIVYPKFIAEATTHWDYLFACVKDGFTFGFVNRRFVCLEKSRVMTTALPTSMHGKKFALDEMSFTQFATWGLNHFFRLTQSSAIVVSVIPFLSL